MKNDSYDLKKYTKVGRVIGLVLIILGSVLTGVLVYLVSGAQSLPRILIAGPAILSQGIGMFIFPGGDFSYKELNNLGSKKGIQRLWLEAPTLHKMAWIMAVVIGVAISFKIMIDQGFLTSL